MIWWGVSGAIVILAGFAVARFVPAEHRDNYHRCRKDRAFWLAQIFSHSIWGATAIQNLFAPSDVPLWLRTVGAVYMVAGYALQIWAWRVNYFLLPIVVYIPPDLRATGGPYRFSKHPFYLGVTCAAWGSVMLLGQWWALFPLAAYLTLILWRVRAENRTLSQQPQ